MTPDERERLSRWISRHWRYWPGASVGSFLALCMFLNIVDPGDSGDESWTLLVAFLVVPLALTWAVLQLPKLNRAVVVRVRRKPLCSRDTDLRTVAKSESRAREDHPQ